MTNVLIDIVYEATTPLGPGVNADLLGKLVMALQLQVDRDFAPIWGASCNLAIASGPLPGRQRLIFLDNADQADALGYHELTSDGLPQGKVFVKTTLMDGENPGVTASHELLEMLADPNVDQVVTGPDGWVRAKENCDAVEETTYEINGVKVSNFVTPAWFDGSKPSGASWDFLKLVKRPCQLLKGGYISILKDGEWQQIFASTRAADAFKAAKKWRPQARESGVMRRSER